MKILFILPEYYPHSGGGISTYYLHYIKAIKAHCSKIKVIVGSGYAQSDDSFDTEGINVEYLKPVIYEKYRSQFSRYDLFPEFRDNIAAAWAMREQAMDGADFDIVECTDFGLGFIPWLLEHKKPVIVRQHGSSGQIALHEATGEYPLLAQLFQSAELSLFPLANTLISHSTSNAQFWNHLLNKDKVKVIHPVYYTKYDPLPFTERENLGLVTARIQQWKGPVELCKAVEMTTSTCQIKWVGRDMPFENGLSTAQHLASAFPNVYNKQILFQSPLPQSSICELQQKAKYGIVSSTWDMFNFTALEFMAAGTPLICSDGAGAAELIEHGKNGFKYSADDVSALARCIDQANSLNENDYMQIAHAAIETVKSKLSPEVLAKANLDVYRLALQSHQPVSENIYFNEAYCPSPKQHKISRVLDRQRLSFLIQYLLKRIKSKMLN